MKNLILTAFVLFVTVTFSTIQGQSFGIKGSYHISNLAVEKNQINESNNKSAFSVGILNRSKLGFLTLQSELLYSRKGAKYDLVNGITTVNANLDYIELPLSLCIRLFNSPLSIYGGGYAAYLVNAEYEFTDANDNVLATYDNKDSFNKLDFGVQLGAQLQMQNLIFDARYSRGLRNVEDEDFTAGGQTYFANDSKNFNFQLGLGFLF